MSNFGQGLHLTVCIFRNGYAHLCDECCYDKLEDRYNTRRATLPGQEGHEHDGELGIGRVEDRIKRRNAQINCKNVLDLLLALLVHRYVPMQQVNLSYGEVRTNQVIADLGRWNHYVYTHIGDYQTTYQK